MFEIKISFWYSENDQTNWNCHWCSIITSIVYWWWKINNCVWSLRFKISFNIWRYSSILIMSALVLNWALVAKKVIFNLLRFNYLIMLRPINQFLLEISLIVSVWWWFDWFIYDDQFTGFYLMRKLAMNWLIKILFRYVGRTKHPGKLSVLGI